MASKIMLVLDSSDDQDFLEKVLIRLKYTVIAMKKGVDLSEQLIDHFPDVVFASTLGRNAKILSALGKIKEVRGKPKLVFVKTKNEKNSLTSEQKDIIDGTLYTPIDPFKLIDLLSNTTELDLIELRRRYNEMLEQDRGRRQDHSGGGDLKFQEGDEKSEEFGKVGGKKGGTTKPDYGQTQVYGATNKKGKTTVQGEDPEFYGTVTAEDFDSESEGTSLVEESGEVGSVHQTETVENNPSLINDPDRRKKYADIANKLKASNEHHEQFDVQKLREKQKAQSEEIAEDPEVKSNRKHFLKTLFSMSPDQVRKKG